MGNNGTTWRPLSLWDENADGSVYYNNGVAVGGTTVSNANYKMEVFGGFNCTKLYVGGVLLAPVSGSSSSSETGTFSIHNENKNTSFTVSTAKTEYLPSRRVVPWPEPEPAALPRSAMRMPGWNSENHLHRRNPRQPSIS